MEKLTRHGSIFTDLVLEVFRVNRLLLEAGDALTEPVGLSSARWQVLGVVEHGPIPVAHVARVMGLTRQSVQQTADSLAEEGLIVYSKNPHHRRAKLMIMTAKGRTALDYVEQHHAQWANQVGAEHTLANLQTAVEVLRQLQTSLERDAPPAADAEA
jgi:DNA-binding MarR family transcriptional regulator